MTIPFSARSWKHGSFHYIQPFADTQGDLGFVELYLDNNALIELARNDDILEGVWKIPGLKGYTLNPVIAFAEQWISNPVFRQGSDIPGVQPENELISTFLAQAARHGKTFAPDYVGLMLRNCRVQESGLRFMAGVLFAYIAAIRSLQRRRMPFEQRMSRFSSIFENDVPIFTGMIALAALTFHVLDNRAAKDTNGSQLISLINSFFDPKKDEPSELTPGYLRNRAMDLLCWYWMPYFYNVNSGPKPPTPMVVTADKFLAGIPFRFVPPFRSQVTPVGLIALGVSGDELFDEDCAAFFKAYKRLSPPPRQQPFPIADKIRLLENLNDAVASILNEEDRAGFQAGRRWATEEEIR
jgi:hypothetical protein